MRLDQNICNQIKNALNSVKQRIDQLSNQNPPQVSTDQKDTVESLINFMLEIIEEHANEDHSGFHCAELFILVTEMNSIISSSANISIPGRPLREWLGIKLEELASRAAKSMELCLSGKDEDTYNIEEVLNKVSAALREVGEAKRAIDDIADDAEEKRDSLDKISTLASDIEKLHEESSKKYDEIEKGNENIKEWEKRVQELLSITEETLKGANKVSLSKSFQDRAQKELSTAVGWSVAFILSLGGMSLMGWDIIKTITPLLNSKGPIDPSSYLVLALKFSANIPLLAIAIFSANQFGKHRNIYQDYDYKAAAAQSYVAYRDEIKDLGQDAEVLLSRLQEMLIDNFGENPVRLLTKAEEKKSKSGFKLSLGKDGFSAGISENEKSE